MDFGISCVDFGHNAEKGVGDTGREVIIESLLGTPKKLDRINFDPNKRKPEECLLIRHENQEFFFGKMARDYSDIVYHTHTDEDENEFHTKLMVLATQAYLIQNHVQKLVTTLPAANYSDEAGERFARSLRGVHKIEFYNFRTGTWEMIDFENIDAMTRPQGFAALMDIFLRPNGKLNPELKKEAAGYNVLVDIGYFSTDIYIMRGMKPVKRLKAKTTPGMVKAYELIAEFLKNELGVRKELYEIQPYATSKSIELGNEEIDISEPVNQALHQLAMKITTDLSNMLPDWREVNGWWLAGGGCHPLYEDIKNRFSEFEKHPRPQKANASGGKKLGVREWERVKYTQ